jgi:serine/threonine protein kinase
MFNSKELCRWLRCSGTMLSRDEEMARGLAPAAANGLRGGRDAVSRSHAFDDALSVLATLHTAGVVHRDVKPQNIILRSDGTAVIVGLGIATLPGEPSRTRQGHIPGTPEYTAPEVVRGERADSRSDLLALGLSLFHVLAGRSAYYAQPGVDLAEPYSVIRGGARVQYNSSATIRPAEQVDAICFLEQMTPPGTEERKGA